MCRPSLYYPDSFFPSAFGRRADSPDRDELAAASRLKNAKSAGDRRRGVLYSQASVSWRSWCKAPASCCETRVEIFAADGHPLNMAAVGVTAPPPQPAGGRGDVCSPSAPGCRIHHRFLSLFKNAGRTIIG